MAEFLASMETMVRLKSVDFKEFKTSPQFNKKDWEKAIELSRCPRMGSVERLTGRFSDYYLIPSEESWMKCQGDINLLKEDKKKYIKFFIKGETDSILADGDLDLDELIRIRHCFYRLLFIRRRENRPAADILYHCSCPVYMQYARQVYSSAPPQTPANNTDPLQILNRCKHVYAQGLAKNQIEKPTHIDCDPARLSVSQGRGRPPRIAPAWVHQHMYSQNP